MNPLFIAIGNIYRRDDGVAHRVLDMLSPKKWGGPPGPRGSPRTRPALTHVLQLTPEMAEDIAPFDRVVFIDADIEPGEPRLTPIEADPKSRSPLGHSLSPQELLILAEKLCDFRGQAWLCRIPGVDFSDGEGLSETAESNAMKAAELLGSFIALE